MATYLGNVAVGSTVKIPENDVPVEFLVVNQGKPSNEYDNSCDGTWLLRKDIHSKRAWNSGWSIKKYNQSSINTFLNGTYLNSIREDIREKIQTAKIKYLNNYDNPWQYTATMETKVFLLSVDEVWPYPLDEYWKYGDGYPLEYFYGVANGPWYDGAEHTAYYNSARSDWYTRTGGIYEDNSGDTSEDAQFAVKVLARPDYEGYIFDDYDSKNDGTQAGGIRPAFILPKDMLVDDDNNVITNQPPTVPESISATNVVGNQSSTSTLGAATDPDGTVESYIYERKVDTGAWQQFLNANSLTATDAIDDSWTTVTYRAKAVDDEGAEGPYATSQEYTVIHNQMPTAPSSISATNVTGNQEATITLGAATDPDGTVESYVYERQVDDGTWQQFADDSSLTVTDEINDSWTTVKYRAKAVDDDGAEGPYATSQAYTVVHNQVPTAPGSISVTNVIGGEPATITITAATDPDGTVVEYVYERNVDSGTYWQQIAQTSNLSVMDSVSNEWGTVAYRARAMDNDGAFGPYATSETYDVNSGWIIISGPNENMGTRTAPFDLTFSVDVTGQSSVADINVAAVMDGETIYNGQVNSGVEVTVPIDARLMSFGTHKIVVSTSKDEYIPATNTYTFTIPAISIPPKGKSIQARSHDEKPVFFRGLGKDIICKNGLSVNDWIDVITKTILHQAMKIYTGQYTGTGTYGSENPNVLTIGCTPMVMQVFEKDGTGILRVITTVHADTDGADGGGILFETGGISGEITQTGISWYGANAEAQMNVNGKEYIWFAIGTVTT